MPLVPGVDYKAVFFDLDGTLVISTIDFIKFRRKLLAYIKGKGADMSRYSIKETTVSMISKFTEEIEGKGLDEDTIERYLDEIDDLLDRIELERIDDTRPADSAERILMSLKDKGVKIGILTRGSPAYAEQALEKAGLTKYIDAIIARDRKSGMAPKPDPESAKALARKLNVKNKKNIIMVGDFSIDHYCAKGYGIRFYGIAPESESRKSLQECGCADISKNLDEFGKKIGI
jgi:phosphoglycolate phosphatase-like HAD superfamily hydrolase